MQTVPPGFQLTGAAADELLQLELSLQQVPSVSAQAVHCPRAS